MATAERPVERKAGRLIGEAEAVAGDMRDCPPQVIERRAAVVVDLLSEVDGTGDPAVDERVAAARQPPTAEAVGLSVDSHSLLANPPAGVSVPDIRAS